ncbi:hypothetical protein LINGRAHAP2_LOCUS22348 [Linum grandiflorum]
MHQCAMRRALMINSNSNEVIVYFLFQLSFNLSIRILFG